MLLPAAHAGRSEHAAQAPSSVAAAGKETLGLIHDQSLAVERNTHYLEQQRPVQPDVAPAEPEDARESPAGGADRASDPRRSAALTHVERNILLSRLHLLATLPGKVGRVYYLLYKMGIVAPEDLRVAAFIAFATRRQQSVLDQLIKILNQEQASTTLPGS